MRLATRVWGEPRRPTVVLVHGLTSTGRTWWRVGPALAESGRFAVAVDLRGHGSSGGATAETTLADLAADVVETVDAAVGDAAVDAIGHSLGALTVLAAAAGGRFRRVVAEDPADSDHRLPQAAEDVLASSALAHSDPERFTAEVRRENPGWPEQDVENELLGHRDLEAEAFASALLGMSFDFLELLDAARARAEILLVLGAEERDSRLQGEVRREAVRRVPVSEHDAGHSVHRDDYDGYVRAVVRFLDGAR